MFLQGDRVAAPCFDHLTKTKCWIGHHTNMSPVVNSDCEQFNFLNNTDFTFLLPYIYVSTNTLSM